MDQQQIINQLLTSIQSDNLSDGDFNQLALQIFAYQYTNNLPLRKFCQQKGKTIRTVRTWGDIPAVPINAFKEVPLTCTDPEDAERFFMTSGTTMGVKGKHYHPTLQVWNESMKTYFKKRFMKETEQIRMGILFPTEEEMPNSSLARYLALAKKEFGTKESHYLLTENGINLEQLIQELEQAERTGKPYALLGASYSFVHLFEELEKLGHSFRLPSGSKVLDTGGFKNQSKEWNLDDFYHQLSSLLGVPRKDCINMYGMTELSSQLYDSGNEQVPSVKSGPHWLKTRIIHPLTGEEVADGERGVIVHCDLANFNSVTTILTEDLGMKVDGGFLLLGRVQGTEAKGCSIAVEEFIQAAKGPVQ
ncbi:long-chain fatty acid--CoA ligase [Bacillus sp. OK048]|uniref:LuxE/PaaK family acyltransferase n=1 Tax=Bacillus sp. OK048 TaxID=1882761 RepID=UPI0008813E4D|nr:long-chain fatty acid--CoA ligase [Bacillus sp. OK048]SDN38554.1 Acyl-protein synthetase, LuxE [Bacillus sp. OK048]